MKFTRMLLSKLYKVVVLWPKHMFWSIAMMLLFVALTGADLCALVGKKLNFWISDGNDR